MEKLRSGKGKEARSATPELNGAVRIEGSPTRCPYCHEDCRQEEARVCSGCLARHHSACWDELGRCGSCQNTGVLSAERQEVHGKDCRACGWPESSVITCLGCQNSVCRHCFKGRFRRCVDCAADWLKAEKRLSHVRGRKRGAQWMVFFTGLFTLAAFCASLAFLAELYGSDRMIALGISVPLGFINFTLLIRNLIRRGRAAREIQEIEEELAPFEESLATRLVSGARDMIHSTAAVIRGER